MRAAVADQESIAPTNLEAHHLAEVLEFRPDQGIIRLHEQRVVLLSAAAMGLLQKELIDTLDCETARRLFLRFGYVDGYHDAVSLRDRREDVPLLVHGFVRRAAQRVKKDVRTVSSDALTAMMRYRWPGNVRELEHAVERAVIVGRGETIKPRDLPPEISQKARQRVPDDSLDLHEQERAMSTVTLWRKVKQYGLGP